MPSMREKVRIEMNKAKLDIENKLVPKGAGVVRHLALPDEGKSSEWILQEMDKMDVEMGGTTNWRQGKLSGAVYRKQYCYCLCSLYPQCNARRWWG